jgi:hypothetical protein
MTEMRAKDDRDVTVSLPIAVYAGGIFRMEKQGTG